MSEIRRKYDPEFKAGAVVLPADRPEPSENPWIDLAGFGAAGVSVEPGEIDEVVYGS